MVEKSQTCLTCMNSVVKHAHGSQNESYVYILTMAISNKAGEGPGQRPVGAIVYVVTYSCSRPNAFQRLAATFLKEDKY